MSIYTWHWVSGMRLWYAIYTQKNTKFIPLYPNNNSILYRYIGLRFVTTNLTMEKSIETICVISKSFNDAIQFYLLFLYNMYTTYNLWVSMTKYSLPPTIYWTMSSEWLLPIMKDLSFRFAICKLFFGAGSTASIQLT